jgi:hypothetical protein
MTFVVLPALVSDISEVYDAYFAAFKDSAVTRALFPTASAEDMTDPASAFRYGSRVYSTRREKSELWPPAMAAELTVAKESTYLSC